MASHVLDASAVLALLQGEPGENRVRSVLRENICLISAVNLAEVATKLFMKGLSEEFVRELCAIPNLKLVPLDHGLAMELARLAPIGQKLGLSLGDRACLALGSSKSVTVLTADKIWKSVPGIRVALIR